MANVGMVGLDWQERINWDRLRKHRLARARERMKAHGLGAMLLMYDENVRYVTSTLTPGWNRLKPGLRYALLCGDDAPVLFTGDLLFAGSIGRMDMPGGSEADMVASLNRVVLPRPDETVIHAGHGGSSTIGRERRTNPYLQNVDWAPSGSGSFTAGSGRG